MSGDRILALCEYGNGTWWSLDDDDPAVQRQNTLVEIAKAARVLLDEYEDEETEHGFPFNFALRDAHRSLRSALARLDGGATEGDA